MVQPVPSILTDSGAFVTGANYWASHAGTDMWRDWRPEVVANDLERLSAAGLQVLRVFPLWPDFQPLSLLYGGAGQPVEFRFGEQPLPDDEAGQAGVSAVMMARFQSFADLAHANGLKLIVGLLTGWMSGRLFIPPALEKLNVLTDPMALMWETRFVRHFVRRFKDHPAIAAWDLGNECNCMAPVPSRQAAWAWTSAITHTIRAEDSTRPVVSGMHSLLPNRDAGWTMQDQGELTDLLTTHPYPYFTPYANQDTVNTIRTLLHSAAESRFYADIGAKPCLVEEIGTLGPMLASDAIAADFARTVLFSAWANDCHGLLWWCAFDQLLLTHAPYAWAAFERELGLMRVDGSPKPVLAELGAFTRWLKTLPFERLPLRRAEAVCILTEEQDSWAAAYASFVLAKQAGFDLEFQFASQPLKPAAFYLVPSVRGGGAMPRALYFELLRRVEQDGATLYLSHDDCLLAPFNTPFGLEVQTRQKRIAPATFSLPSAPGAAFSCPAPYRLEIKPTRSEVLARETDGNPLWTVAAHGKGHIYFLSLPIERVLSETPGSFYGPTAQPFWRFYHAMAAMAEPFFSGRALRKDNPQVGLTEHPIDAASRIAVLINYSPEDQPLALELAPGWSIRQMLYGASAWSKCSEMRAPKPCNGVLPHNDALVFLLAFDA